MKIRKSAAWWLTWLALIILYIFTLIISVEVSMSVGPVIIGALAFSGLGYQGMNVLDNFQKSKFYRPELDKAT
jgi:hypothetical protein